MAGPNGGKRPGSGRKAGILNKLSKSDAIPVEWKGQTPAEFLQSVMQDETQDISVRMEAAKVISPYVHKKRPEAREISAQVDMPVPITVFHFEPD